MGCLQQQSAAASGAPSRPPPPPCSRPTAQRMTDPIQRQPPSNLANPASALLGACS
eukprot:CAMPEP_0202883872 /NCGR_PEP_ID=MMETSP1391-20130828/40112_1 /ASSEMBLY_ACC=CAM_ASM_000867 /TAXON_ID=1034604 /ORGANISM="Chlamydomonas leiostraca, Strain SAG 11-49" /LENGTH=55 /DNA_ID=CAMNT_0049566963 /DNA_START=201 /DNA_END=365 /DNA_ORIENTATION=+